MIKAEIIADSLNSVGNRLTTFVLEYPRYVHSELMTHRVFSKNAASSRAIPIEKMIQQVIENPAMPTHWGKNQSGMQANEELSEEKTLFVQSRNDFGSEYISPKECAKRIWLDARDEAIASVRKLDKLGLHKQIANRILEPWFHIKIILSGTEYENWFALRAHKDAHPDIRKLAEIMLEAYNQSEPKKLKSGEWHIPFGDKIDSFRANKLYEKFYNQNELTSVHVVSERLCELRRKIAVARCARISYFNFEGKDDYEADVKLCDRLFANIPKHLSPTEHVAQALETSEWIGNFRGFKQYRKFFADENLSDPRVAKKS
jgi:thymidylate synthase ThyX